MSIVSKIPSNIIFPDASLRIWHETERRLNRTSNCVVIEGNRNGFLSLANILLYRHNDLDDVISLNCLSFVNSDIEFEIVESFACGVSSHQPVVVESGQRYQWKLSYVGFLEAVAAIHSLAHINPEIHFDMNMDDKLISVYCVVE